MCKWSINARFFNSFYRLPTLKVNVNAVGVLDTNKISTIFLKKKCHLHHNYRISVSYQQQVQFKLFRMFQVTYFGLSLNLLLSVQFLPCDIINLPMITLFYKE